jgi:hypothetical protein
VTRRRAKPAVRGPSRRGEPRERVGRCARCSDTKSLWTPSRQARWRVSCLRCGDFLRCAGYLGSVVLMALTSLQFRHSSVRPSHTYHIDQTTQVLPFPIYHTMIAVVIAVSIVYYHGSKQSRGWPWRYCNDHWEPEDRERHSDVRFPGPLTLMLSNILLSFLASTTLVPAFSALSFSSPFLLRRCSVSPCHWRSRR